MIYLYSEGYMQDQEGNFHVPVSIEFQIDEKAGKGKDYRIDLFFKYKYQDNWYITRETLTIHVRGIIEKYAMVITVGVPAIISILLILFGLALRYIG